MKFRYHVMFIFLAIAGSIIFLSGLTDAKNISFTSSNMMTADDPAYLYTPGMLLSEGDYNISISYQTSSDFRIDIYGDYNANYIDTLTASSSEYHKQISLTEDAQGAKIRLTLPVDGSLTIHNITVSSDHPIYMDSIYFTVLYLIILLLIWLFFCKKWYLRLTKIDWITYGCLGLLILFCSIPQLRTSLIDGTDLGGQLIRIEGIKDALLERQFPVVLFPRTANEYGELGVMYPHLFLYPLAVLRALNISLTTVYSTACVFSNIICVLFTYMAVRSIFKTNYGSLMVTILFAFAPAHVATITQDGSLLGSGFAAMFLAFIIAGIYHILLDDISKWWYLLLGLTGVFQSHLVTTLIVLLVLSLISLLSIKQFFIKDRLLAMLKAIVSFIMINLWYIILFVHYYTTERLGLSALGDHYFVYSFTEQLNTDPNFLLSAVFLAAGIIFIICYRKHPPRYYAFLIHLVMIDAFLLLMVTDILPWELLRANKVIRFFTSTLQFASRLYIVTILIGAVLFAALLQEMIVSQMTRSISIAAAFCIMIFINASSVLNYIQSDHVFITQKIGYLQPYIQREYLPPDTENEFFASKSCILSNDTEIHAEGYQKHGSRLIFSYQTALTDAYVEVPLFYYNDYSASFDDGTPVVLTDGTHHRIRIELPYTDNMRTVILSFHSSPLNKLWAMISMLSTILCIYLVRKNKI